MKTCGKGTREEIKLIGGNIYQLDRPGFPFDRDLYFYSENGNNLINLESGSVWSVGNGTAGYRFTDVTDQYCLAKVEK